MHLPQQILSRMWRIRANALRPSRAKFGEVVEEVAGRAQPGRRNGSMAKEQVELAEKTPLLVDQGDLRSTYDLREPHMEEILRINQDLAVGECMQRQQSDEKHSISYCTFEDSVFHTHHILLTVTSPSIKPSPLLPPPPLSPYLSNTITLTTTSMTQRLNCTTTTNHTTMCTEFVREYFWCHHRKVTSIFECSDDNCIGIPKETVTRVNRYCRACGGLARLRAEFRGEVWRGY